jgi:hypothetical protein
MAGTRFRAELHVYSLKLSSQDHIYYKTQVDIDVFHCLSKFRLNFDPMEAKI